MARELTQAAQAAKLIRQWLRAENIPARVTSENYSMGCNVKIYLTDQIPAVRQKVKDYCAQYEYGSFDPMQDLYNYDNVKKDIPQAKYVFVTNELSADLEQKVWDFAKGYYNFLADAPADVKAIYNIYVPEFNNWAGTIVRQLFSGDFNNAYWDAQK